MASSQQLETELRQLQRQVAFVMRCIQIPNPDPTLPPASLLALYYAVQAAAPIPSASQPPQGVVDES